MKICFFLLLFIYIRPSGCPIFDFKLKTVRNPENTESKNIQLEAILHRKPQQAQTNSNSGKETAQDYDVDYINEADAYKIAMPTKLEEEKTRKITRSECGLSEDLEHFVGSNLFDLSKKKCFSKEDAVLLITRKDFELLLPKDLPHCVFNDKMIGVIMDYFCGCNNIIKHLSEETKPFMERAFYDALGGYLKSYLLPIIKYSFYAGTINLKTYENLESLYDQCKTFLNTNGNGWRLPVPEIINELKSIQIKPFEINADFDNNNECCTHLDLTVCKKGEQGEKMIVSLPKLEALDKNGHLANIWLPFRNKRTYNLKAPTSAFVLAKFYETVTHCYRFQRICQDNYNHKFKNWLVNNIQDHLFDDIFYPGLGAVLRICEVLSREKKSADFDASKTEDSSEIDIQDDAKSLENEGIITKFTADADADANDELVSNWNDGISKDSSKTSSNIDLELYGLSDENIKPKNKYTVDSSNNDLFSSDGTVQDFDTFSMSEANCGRKFRWKWILWFLLYLILALLFLILLILLIRWIISYFKSRKDRKKDAPLLGKKKDESKKTPARKKKCFCLRSSKNKKSDKR